MSHSNLLVTGISKENQKHTQVTPVSLRGHEPLRCFRCSSLAPEFCGLILTLNFPASFPRAGGLRCIHTHGQPQEALSLAQAVLTACPAPHTAWPAPQPSSHLHMMLRSFSRLVGVKYQ